MPELPFANQIKSDSLCNLLPPVWIGDVVVTNVVLSVTRTCFVFSYGEVMWVSGMFLQG